MALTVWHKSKFTLFSDISGHQTSNGSTIPPSMTVTPLKPDIVIVDKKEKKAMIYELTCPFESNIHKQHKYKSDKYSNFETDVKQYHTKVVAF